MTKKNLEEIKEMKCKEVKGAEAPAMSNLMGSDCEYSCQPQTRGEPCEINIWELIKGFIRFR